MMPEFTDEGTLTVAVKEKILSRWRRFLKNGLQRQDFTEALYHFIHQNCDFIAHYNIHGFYEEYFLRGDDKIRFLKQFDRQALRKQPHRAYWLEGCYSDLANAMVMEAEKYLPVLYAAARAEQKERDLRIAEKLLAKHGYTLNETIKPIIAPAAIKSAPATQVSLF